MKDIRYQGYIKKILLAMQMVLISKHKNIDWSIVISPPIISPRTIIMNIWSSLIMLMPCHLSCSSHDVLLLVFKQGISHNLIPKLINLSHSIQNYLGMHTAWFEARNVEIYWIQWIPRWVISGRWMPWRTVDLII